jgi:ABC-type Fe3+/spermidine/putrescine transport system ATPase subunit
MAVMRDGTIEQLGDPRTVYRAPANRFVADFIGETNWLSASIERVLAETVLLQTAAGPITSATRLSFKPGQKVWLGFRPEAVQIGASDLNSFKTTIAHVSYLGEIEQYGLELSPGRIIKAFEQNPLEIRRPGAPLVVHVRPQDCLVLPET